MGYNLYLKMEYIGNITHLLTFDPNFLGHPSMFLLGFTPYRRKRFIFFASKVLNRGGTRLLNQIFKMPRKFEENTKGIPINLNLHLPLESWVGEDPL